MAFLDSAASAADDAESSGPPPGGGGGPPQSPPMGGGPLLASIAGRQRGPQVSAPGPGDMGASMGLVMQAYGMLKQALPGLQHGSPIEQDVLKITSRLSRHLPQGPPTIGVQQTQLQDLLKSVLKNALIYKLMGQGAGGQGGPGGPGGPEGPGGGGPPGAMAQAPMPSTPLPGA